MNMSFGIYYKASSVFKLLDWLSIKEKFALHNNLYQKNIDLLGEYGMSGIVICHSFT